MVLGRSDPCDLQLTHRDVSRRHAKIVCSDSGYTLSDLSSTNGTFINGERTDEHLLASGDQIRIGETDIVFYVLGARPMPNHLSTGDSTATTDVSINSMKAGDLVGELQEIPPFGLIQLLEMERKSGLLHFEGERAGRFWFVDGAPAHAESEDLVGEAAALHMLEATAGEFRFESGPAAPELTIGITVTELVLKAAKLEDERDATTR